LILFRVPFLQIYIICTKTNRVVSFQSAGKKSNDL
jgi:hypothetical protein